jgi:Type I phosphodiesterase / nucleotide pyrophosphatase
MTNKRSCLMVLADGARVDLFEELLAAGELPNIQRHVIERGSYRRASSVFTSTTGPAHLPFLTGCYPGTANVPGYRWFDRAAYRPGLPMGPWCLRSYNGPEAWLYVKDLDPDTRTLYEIVEDPINVFGVITRGVPRARSLGRRVKSPLWLWAHYAHDYVTPDRLAARLMRASLSRTSELRFIAFPGIDWMSHYVDPAGPGAIEGYRIVDRAVGDAAERLRGSGAYEDTLIVICSDHGHHPVHTHWDIGPELERQWGIACAYHSGKVWRRSPEAVSCVSGNGMAHLYFGAGGWRRESTRDELDAAHPGLLDWLLREPAIDLVVTRAREGGLLVESRRARAKLAEREGGVEYEPLDGDPFGFAELPARMDAQEALARTLETGYPDGLVQLAQLFRSPRTGDLVVSATPGFDLRERYENPEHLSSHGALYRQHMLVPLALSEPLQEGPVRTVDVFNTTLEWLGREQPEGVDGVSRLMPR